MKVEQVPIGDLKPYPNNPRNNEDAIGEVAASIKKYGFVQPIVVDRDFVIIIGHTRLEASKRLGLETVPVVVAANLSEEQTRQLRLVDNKVGEIATWVDGLLARELATITMTDGEWELPGFTADEINRLLATEPTPETDSEDDAPAPPAETEAVSKLGETYILGSHRLICGDATKADTIAGLMRGERADLLLTDPPYNVGYDGGGTTRRDRIENDQQAAPEFLAFLTAAFGNATRHMAKGAAFYIWHADTEREAFMQSARAAGLRISSILIWAKSKFVLSWCDYQWKHEPCLYGWLDNGTHKFYGDRTQTTLQKAMKDWPAQQTPDGCALSIGGQTYLIKGKGLKVTRLDTTLIEYEAPKRSPLHPTMKPIGLLEIQILNSSQTGEIVLDLFCGSGSTIIACEKTGRRARAAELSPAYCDVIRQRWAEHKHGKLCDWQRLTPKETT